MAESRVFETQPVTVHPLSRRSISLDSLLSLIWWDHTDLNCGPTNYAYYYNFRYQFPVCSLDYTLPLQPSCLVSTPSIYFK